MQQLSIQTIRRVINGQLLHGEETGTVQALVNYVAGERTKPNTLLFVRKSDELDWTTIATPAVIVSNKEPHDLHPPTHQVTVLRVPNVLTAYWQIVQHYRQLFTLPVVAITGTCGKTTTKEMLYHMLQPEHNTVISDTSQNEPRQSLRYLTRITRQTDVAVFELGLGNSGNITHQCNVYQPTIGVLLNIGVHHLDGCGDLAGYRKAKGELLEGVSGTLIVNADDEQIQQLPLKSFKGTLKTFGLQKADVRGSDLMYTQRGIRFSVHVEGQTYQAFVPGLGVHQVYNALAALAVVSALGHSVQRAILRLRTFPQLTHHLEMKEGVAGSTIVDDTWTTNPTSIEAALQAVIPLAKGKKLIIVLGEINRLGRFEARYYEQIGTLLSKQSLFMLITVGKRAEAMAKQAQKQGFNHVHHVDKASSVVEKIKPLLAKDVIVLVKGPMAGKGLRDVVAAITKERH